MSDEFCAGVQIILKRMESNPDEFINPHEYKWQKVVAGVFARKEGISTEGVGAVRGLTDAEIDALYEGFVKLARPAFDEYVMKNVLDDTEELKYQAKERYVQGFTDPRMYQNAIQPGAMISVTAGGSGGSGQVQIKPESVMSKLKRELGL
jgi:hypothetical protein